MKTKIFDILSKKGLLFIAAIAMTQFFASCSRQLGSIQTENKLQHEQALITKPSSPENNLKAVSGTKQDVAEIKVKESQVELISSNDETHSAVNKSLAHKTNRNPFKIAHQISKQAAVILNTQFAAKNLQLANRNISSTHSGAQTMVGHYLKIAIVCLVIGLVCYIFPYPFWIIGSIFVVIALIFLLFWLLNEL